LGFEFAESVDQKIAYIILICKFGFVEHIDLSIIEELGIEEEYATLCKVCDCYETLITQ